jgi:transcriptional regulator with XRE-family HTH domain
MWAPPTPREAPFGCLWYETCPLKASFFKARISRASLKKASSVNRYFVDLPAKTTIGSRIRAVREKAGLTQAEFGRRLGGVAWMQISRYERGRALPKVETLIRMRLEFGTSLDRLLTGREGAWPVGTTERDVERLSRRPPVGIVRAVTPPRPDRRSLGGSHRTGTYREPRPVPDRRSNPAMTNSPRSSRAASREIPNRATRSRRRTMPRPSAIRSTSR